MIAKRHIAVLVGLVCIAVPSSASAATTKKCADARAHGITAVRAKNVSCGTAMKIAQKYNYGQKAKGWSCRGKRLSKSRERVTCKKGKRTVVFRSTYAMELPPADAPPSAGGGGS